MTESELNLGDQQGNTALHSAIKSQTPGYLQVISMLLDAGIGVDLCNKQGDTALHLAVRKNDYKAAHLLLCARANTNIPNEKGDTPLHIATQKGDHLMVDALLKGGADVNLANKQGKISLNVATERGHMAVANLLEGAALLFVKPKRRNIQIVNVADRITSILQQRLTTAAITFDFFSKEMVGAPRHNNEQTAVKDRLSLAK